MRKWIQLALLVLCFFCLSGAALAASAVTPDGYFNGIRLFANSSIAPGKSL